jgi:ribonuclease T1
VVDALAEGGWMCSAFHVRSALATLCGLIVLALVGQGSISVALSSEDHENNRISTISVSDLPPAARETLRLVEVGGPFPYSKDGAVFGNRERLLPRKPRGYYREFTVPTPGVRDRGPRRIIIGRDGQSYYTDDHYRSFKRILE